MIIKKRRVRNVSHYMRHILSGSKLVIGLSDLDRFAGILEKLGFEKPWREGQTILPMPVGPVSLFNAEGSQVPQKDKPMETAYREVEWHWEEWHGRDTVSRSKWVDVPYKRYPRKFTPPLSVEMSLRKDPSGNFILVTAPIVVNDDNVGILTHTVNLFLELFRECEFFSEELVSHLGTAIVRLNWNVFPPGEMPWERLKGYLDPIVKKARGGNQTLIYHRLEFVNNLKPDFVAVGRGGFHGYVIHGFVSKNIFVLESIYYGNATYVFEEKWEELSKMTKAEILRGSLQKDRIIHRVGWDSRVREVVNGR